MSPASLAQFIHPYYVASGETGRDAAFEDGKRRAIRVLEHHIEQVRGMVLADYERVLCPQQVAA